ncbi:MAG: leucine-rich repeat domain-containing protein [Leptospiraceae bacterium]|nr:leucine-rich repeat domain-containing protein [Leptospiraceae bacterium]
MQRLSLSNNKISDIEPLKDLKSIERIDLSGNKDLISIPEALLNIPSLQNITIDYLQNKNLMEEIEKNDKDVIKGAKEYYRKKRETLSQIQKQVKVILIGDGNSGKTSLLRRLLLDGFSDNSATTHGIRLEEDYFEIGNDKVKIKYWDMGGQDVYHSPHSFFFSDNTIYLLVLFVMMQFLKTELI